MIALSDAQIQQIEEHLEANGLTYEPLQEELLDHVCCLVEEEMWNEKATFEAALKKAMAAFEDFNFKQIQEQTLTIYISKSISMKKVMMMAAMLVVFLVFGASAIQEAVPYNPPSIMPIKGGKNLITSGFGIRMHPIHKVKKEHKGVDFKAKIGTPVLATGDGVVSLVKSDKKGYGKHVVINHEEQYQSVYANLSVFKVKNGDKVKKGDVIALSGNSGASTVPHLHYEVRKDGKAVNPSDYFTE